MAIDTHKYTVEGELLTMEQLKKRLSHIHPVTVRRRVYRGLRTWVELGGCTAAGQALNRQRLQGAHPLADAQEDEEEFKFGEEFDLELDAIAPDRNLQAFLRDESAIADCLNAVQRHYGGQYE